MTSRLRLACLLVLFASPTLAQAQAPVSYRLSFPEPEHRWMRVEATFPDLSPGPLELHMSRSSPGRYALHEFSKNVFDVNATDAGGHPLAVARTNLHQWRIAKHPGAVRVTYRVFGDRIDGTYLAVDTTHAHINMPASVIWARGLEDRPITIHFDPPAGANWRVATQLLPGLDALTFTAPNLQYLMDSPSEFSAFDLRSFSIADGSRNPTFRVAVHHDGSGADLDSFARDVERVVREARQVFGEFPAFEGNTYTFIGDYLPRASGDAMEHRNSTVLSAPASIRSNRLRLLDSISHEFFHSWNVERIRPRALEPFNFDDVNVTGELWLAEGFNNYYGPLVLRRANLTQVDDFVDEIIAVINEVTLSPARRLGSAEDMSRLAPLTDAATAIDRTNFRNTFLSYYIWGEAIALGLDLSLRERSGGKVTLDHFMRALWGKYGRPGGKAPGYVDRPYTAADVKSALATVAGDAKFAEDFFERYIEGHEVEDYARLLRQAGFLLRARSPGQAFAGELRLQESGGQLVVAALVPIGSPAYDAGLERDDVILSVGGNMVRTAGEADRVIRARKPGEMVMVTFERRGQRVMAALRLVEDPRQELVPMEKIGQPLSDAQKRFRDAWLNSAMPNTF